MKDRTLGQVVVASGWRLQRFPILAVLSLAVTFVTCCYICHVIMTIDNQVRIEKIRMEKPGWKDTEDSGDCLSE